MSQSPELRAFRDAIFPPPPAGCCATCRRPVLGFRDDLSKCEYGISQMCQHCQDGVFADIEAIADELGFDLDGEGSPPPDERSLVELAQQPAVSIGTQRWIASELYGMAYCDGGVS